MSEDISILGNLAGIVGAVLAAWQLKLDLWKGILLGAVLVLLPLIFEEIWVGASNGGMAAGVIGFVAVASVLKISPRHAFITFAYVIVAIVLAALMIQADSLQSV